MKIEKGLEGYLTRLSQWLPKRSLQSTASASLGKLLEMKTLPL